MTDFQVLFEKALRIKYPEEVMVQVEKPLPQQAFFPGGRGTIDNSESISNRTIMCLGQDWGTYDDFLKDQVNGGENIEKNPTWKNLRTFLKNAGIDENHCFYTNAIMGLRRDGSASGKSPAFKNPEFIKECQDFFLKQLEVQQPKLILVLGILVVKFLSTMSSDLDSWKHSNSFKILDKSGDAVKKARFSNGVETNLVVLVHPSFRPLNVKLRTFKDFNGHKAELEMIEFFINYTTLYSRC